MIIVQSAGVSYTYRKGRTALDEVDLTAAEGTILGILGPNGSGKSTMLRLIAGLMEPSHGEIRRQPELRETATVLDHTPFLESLTGRDNVEHHLALRGRRDVESAFVWFGRFGLASRADEPVYTYSRGMRRRLALVEALASAPRLLLLDEPSSGLDPEGQSTLVEVLMGVAREDGTVVLATNDHELAAAVCDYVVVLHAGRKVTEGSPRELVRALGRPTVIEVALQAGVQGERLAGEGDLPAGLTRMREGGGVLRFSTHAGTAKLPDLCSWLSDHQMEPSEIRIHAPNLGDVFFELTGVPLSEKEPE